MGESKDKTKLKNEAIMDVSAFPLNISLGKVMKFHITYPSIAKIGNKKLEHILSTSLALRGEKQQGSVQPKGDIELESGFFWDFIDYVDVENKEGNIEKVDPSKTVIWNEIRNETYLMLFEDIQNIVNQLMEDVIAYCNQDGVFNIITGQFDFPEEVEVILPFPILISAQDTRGNSNKDSVVSITLRQMKQKELYKTQSDNTVDKIMSFLKSITTKVKGKTYEFDIKSSEVDMALEFLNFANFCALMIASERLTTEGNSFRSRLKVEYK